MGTVPFLNRTKIRFPSTRNGVNDLRLVIMVLIYSKAHNERLNQVIVSSREPNNVRASASISIVVAVGTFIFLEIASGPPARWPSCSRKCT